MRVPQKPLSSKIIMWFAPIALFGFILRGLAGRWPIGQGDSASYVDFLTFKTSGKPLISNLTLSPWNIYGSHGYIYDSAAQFCKRNFINAYANISNIHWHPHLIVFFTGTIGKIFFFLPASLYALSFEAVSYTVGILLILKYLRDNHVGAINMITLTFILISSPLFVRSLLGQPYLDRLAFGPLIAFVFFRIKRDIDSWKRQITNLLFLISISLISERAALTVGLLSLVLSGLSLKRKEIKFHGIYSFSFSFIPIIWFLYWKNTVATSDYYNNVNIQSAISNFKMLFSPSRSQNLITYVLVVLPFLLIIFLGSFKLFLVAVAFLIPNLVVNVGGAELSGYYTHYHAMYLPIILAFSAISVVEFSRKWKSQSKCSEIAILILSLSIFLSCFANFRTFDTNQSLPTNTLRTLGKSLNSLGLYEPKEYGTLRDAYTKFLKQLNLSSEAHSISAPETLFPVLLNAGFKKIDYFPVGVGYSDYLLVPLTSSLDQNPDISIYGLMPKAIQNISGGCFQEKINNSYQRVQKTNLLGTDFILYSRIQ